MVGWGLENVYSQLLNITKIKSPRRYSDNIDKILINLTNEYENIKYIKITKDMII